MAQCVLGIDTSCYTTSVALADSGEILSSQRRLLTVDMGERGLRQSKAVFQHVLNLPDLMEALLKSRPEDGIRAICVSARPRDVEGSYMPVFVAGQSFARAMAAGMGVPLYETSHQQGHVRAAMVGSGLADEEFVAIHLSGGTTESLFVRRDGDQIRRLHGSSDLHAGQLIDRVGVALGLPFPAGPHLEALAREGDCAHKMPLSVKDGEISFSGAEAQAMRMIQAGDRREDVAAETFGYVTRALARLLRDAQRETGLKSALISGGVASSGLLRDQLPRRLEKAECDMQIFWGKRELSGDNACGVALIGTELDTIRLGGMQHGGSEN